MITRICTKCGEEKAATREFFPRHDAGKYGLHSLCIPCKKVVDKNLRNRPDQAARQKAWRDANKDKIKKYNADYRASGYKSTDNVAKWREKNIDAARKKEAERARVRRATVPWYRLKTRISARVSRMLIDGKQSKTTMEILGYDAKELCAHLEKQFLKGMSWENMHLWEVDHIIPVSHFKADTIDSEDFKTCWALSNLRPLWRTDNRKKGAKVETLI